MLLSVLLAPTACKKKRRQPAPVVDNTYSGLATMVQVSDPRAEVQLTKGFYVVENNSWRWTAKAFTVTLRPPKGAAQTGARLVLKFAVPDVILNRLKSVQLSARVNGLDLPPEQYTTAGDKTYSREVPASSLGADAVMVEFTLDKAFPPTPSDNRELGVIVSSVGFEAK